MTGRDAYRAFVSNAPDLPIFMYDWYLDAVSAADGGSWDAVTLEKAGRMVAVWPFYLKKKLGRTYVAMPPLCRLAGPYLLPEYRQTRHETSMLEDLLKKLPPLAAFEQDCNYSLSNWLPFYWQGFRQTTRYSYVIHLNDLQTVKQALAADYRNQKIPKAQEKVVVEQCNSLDEFLAIHNQSYVRQGMKPPVSTAFLKQLDQALEANHSRTMLFARDRENGALHSVAYLIWDKHASYYLMAGDHPERRASGAGILLAWEAIRYTHEVLKLPVFDFAGSMIRSVERVRRQFGAVQQPYFRLQKEWAVLWKLIKIYRMFKK